MYLPLLYRVANILLHTLEPVMIRTHLNAAEQKALCCIFLNSCGSAGMHHYGQCWKHRQARGTQTASAVNQSPRKEVEREGKGKREPFLLMDTLDVARSNRHSHSVGAGVKCHVGMRCCLDTIWIFQLPVCLFPVNKVLCFITFVPVILHLN